MALCAVCCVLCGGGVGGGAGVSVFGRRYFSPQNMKYYTDDIFKTRMGVDDERSKIRSSSSS